jgi:hypothetical protein
LAVLVQATHPPTSCPIRIINFLVAFVADARIAGRMKIFATTAAALAAVFMAVASAAESGLRNLQTDCNDIIEFKLYEPGMCAVGPVRTPGAPCFLIQRLREGQCLSTSKVDGYNIMMSTKNPTGGCGTTQPACGRLKLFSTSTGKVIRRQVEFSTYWILPALGAECF